MGPRQWGKKYGSLSGYIFDILNSAVFQSYVYSEAKADSSPNDALLSSSTQHPKLGPLLDDMVSHAIVRQSQSLKSTGSTPHVSGPMIPILSLVLASQPQHAGILRVVSELDH
jgi:hypothetical protein